MHDGDLGDARRRQPRLVRKRAAALHEHLALIEQVRAARLHEMISGSLFSFAISCHERLPQAHGRNGAALDGAVARHDQRALAGYDADAHDAPAAHDAGPAVVVMHAEACQRGQFEKRRSVVEQARDALARQDLAAFGELLRLLRGMRDDGPLKAAEFLDLREKMRGIRREGFGLWRDARGDHRHRQRPP